MKRKRISRLYEVNMAAPQAVREPEPIYCCRRHPLSVALILMVISWLPNGCSTSSITSIFQGKRKRRSKRGSFEKEESNKEKVVLISEKQKSPKSSAGSLMVDILSRQVSQNICLIINLAESKVFICIAHVGEEKNTILQI